MVDISKISRLSGLDQSEIMKENDSFNDTSMYIHDEHHLGDEININMRLKQQQ